MKYFFCLFLFAGMAGCGHRNPDHYRVAGDIKGLRDGFIYLQRQVGDSAVLDSTVVKDGKFQFVGQLATPEQVYITTKERAVPFYLENGDIRLVGNFDSLDKLRITGSATQALQDSLTGSMQPMMDMNDTVSDAYEAAEKGGDSTKLAIAAAKLDSIHILRDQATAAFIRTHPGSPISLYQIQSMTYSGSYNELEPLFGGLDAASRNSPMGQYLSKYLSVMKSREVGARIMDFTQNDVKGHPVRLADYRKGRYVLLDFWASWCGPCRAENPNLLTAYNRFKMKKFIVLGVSLDVDSSNWRKAIVKDGLPWTQVSDLKGWKNQVSQLYGIQGIPANFLIDTSGIIIATNLRGPALEKELAAAIR